MVQSAPTSASQWWIQDCAKEGGGFVLGKDMETLKLSNGGTLLRGKF